MKKTKIRSRGRKYYRRSDTKFEQNCKSKNFGFDSGRERFQVNSI